MNATQEILSLVAAKLGDPVYHPASGSAIGRALKINPTSISRMQRGLEFMSRDVFARAARFLDLPPAKIASYAARITLDATPNDDTGQWLRERMNFETVEKVKTAGKISSLTGAAILAVLSAHPVPLQAAGYTPSDDAVHASPYIHYAKLRRRRITRRTLPYHRYRVPRRTVCPPHAA